MSASTRYLATMAAVTLVASAGGTAAYAQAPSPPANVAVSAYAMVGNINFGATESFETVLGSPSGSIVGGGTRIGLGFGGWFFDVGAWRYRGSGERVFVAGDTVFPLGIPVTVTVTPIEVSGGWRFVLRRVPKLVPYLAGGLTSMYYREMSEFATAQENTDAFFNGYHVVGGAAYKITRWLGVAGEASWSTVPDAIGESGVSEAFDETDLGGTTFRVKITLGR